jgi:hypothetical protein
MSYEDNTQQNNQQRSSYYQPYWGYNVNEERAGLVRELSPHEALIKSIAEFRGEIENPKNPREKIKIKRIMNEEGIAIFYMAVTAAANDINTMSNYRADEALIYRIMNKWIVDIIYEFYYNRKKYEITDESQVNFIVNKAVGLMLPSFFKALGAGDRNAATRSVYETINRAFNAQANSDEPPQAKKGFISRLLPW